MSLIMVAASAFSVRLWNRRLLVIGHVFTALVAAWVMADGLSVGDTIGGKKDILCP